MSCSELPGTETQLFYKHIHSKRNLYASSSTPCSPLDTGQNIFHPIAPKLICHVQQLQLDLFLGQIPWHDLGARNVCRRLSRSHPGSDLIWQLYLFMVTSRAAAAQNVQAVQGGGGMGRCHQHGQSLAEGSWGCLCIQPGPVQLLPEGAYYR